LLEAEKVLLERQAGEEMKDKAFAKRLQVKESKDMRDKIEAVLKYWLSNLVPPALQRLDQLIVVCRAVSSGIRPIFRMGVHLVGP
jgi:hypothetical protein